MKALVHLTNFAKETGPEDWGWIKLRDNGIQKKKKNQKIHLAQSTRGQ